MNLDFLDYGLPLEPDDFEEASKTVARFRKYCEELGKKPSELTDEELKRFNGYYEYNKSEFSS